MPKDNFDKFLNKILKDAEIEVHKPLDEVEQIIAEKIKIMREQKKKKRQLILQVAVLVIALSGISGLIFFPQPVYALKQQIIQTIINLGKSISINLDSDTTSSQLMGVMEREIAAVQPEVPFGILIPRYVPPGFEFKSIKQSPNDEQIKIILTFVKENSAIMLMQSRVSENFSISVNINAQQGEAKEVQAGRYQGTMITFIDGASSLTWLTENNILCELLGDITPEQAMEMAVSMQ